MSNKINFIKVVTSALESSTIDNCTEEEIQNAKDYLSSLSKKSELTEKGLAILQAMKKLQDTKDNKFTATELGAELFLSSRSVSGSIRKLISDGLVYKDISASPVVYSMTTKGLEYNVTIKEAD